MLIRLAARDSLLSIAQVQEVIAALPPFEYTLQLLKTTGDLDQKTSLRQMDKTDFFTRELDTLLLEGKCDATIHSAKDLPDPLPRGLFLAAITKGVDGADVLVMREGETLCPGARVATSSLRREKAVGEGVTFVDVRGTIQARLALLQTGEVDGVVVAEAALVRLKLTHLNRIRLTGEVAPLQGQLAIITREEDLKTIQFFSSLDTRISGRV